MQVVVKLGRHSVAPPAASSAPCEPTSGSVDARHDIPAASRCHLQCMQLHRAHIQLQWGFTKTTRFACPPAKGLQLEEHTQPCERGRDRKLFISVTARLGQLRKLWLYARLTWRAAYGPRTVRSGRPLDRCQLHKPAIDASPCGALQPTGTMLLDFVSRPGVSHCQAAASLMAVCAPCRMSVTKPECCSQVRPSAQRWSVIGVTS